jgi:nitroreductase
MEVPMRINEINAVAVRQTDVEATVSDQFLARWSPRAMSGQALTVEQVSCLIEAARWAPSCFNAQPWRFAWAIAGTAHWQPLFDSLIEANQRWVKNAGALIAVASRIEFEHNDQPAPTHSFDAGAAWMSMALQAQAMGLVSHGMRGFDMDKAREALAVPELYDLPAIIAVGYPGDIEELPESLRAREAPSDRKKHTEIAFEGRFAPDMN